MNKKQNKIAISNLNNLLCCPFCKAPGKVITEFEDDIFNDLFPSNKAVRCTGGCWIDGVLIDYEAWQNATKS